LAFLACALSGGLVVSACASSASGGSGSSGQGNTQPLIIGVFNPYSGANASYGPEGASGCFAASTEITKAGGILGHKSFTCSAVDTKGDPVDAVPAARRMIATTTNLVGVLGPSSDEASATAPILNGAKVPMMADTGQVLYDHTNLRYFWRNTPSDDFYGYAMALYGHDAGYSRAALVFGNDISDQGTVPTLIKGFTKLGGHIAINEAIALDQPGYQSEVRRIIAAHPDVIFDELDPQTAATFFGELQQAGSRIPMISTGAQYTNWISAVSRAMGASNLAKIYHNVLGYSSAGGPAFDAYQTNLLASAAKVPDAKQWAHDPFSQAAYDGVIDFALAMVAAKSTSPAVWNSYVTKVSNPSPGAVIVHTFAEGKAALAAGKTIDYVGVTGQAVYNSWHNSNGAFTVTGYAPVNGARPLIKVYSAAAAVNLEG
jgi:ABC-type branched-subunit amino acid transport system substrate-binding protein